MQHAEPADAAQETPQTDQTPDTDDPVSPETVQTEPAAADGAAPEQAEGGSTDIVEAPDAAAAQGAPADTVEDPDALETDAALDPATLDEADPFDGAGEGEERIEAFDRGADPADPAVFGDGGVETADADALTQSGADAFGPLMDLVEAGGPVLIILAAVSVLSLGVIALKLWSFLALQVTAHRFVEPVIARVRAGDLKGALADLARRRGPLPRVMEAAVRGKGFGRDSEEAVREEVARVAHVQMDGLEKGLSLLSTVAALSPLLGLLGTVLGMIAAFQQLESAGDTVDPAILSGGIWEALLTTAAGLTVAIPAAAAHAWLQRTVDVVGQRMEDTATRVFTVDLYGEAPTRARGEPGVDGASEPLAHAAE